MDLVPLACEDGKTSIISTRVGMDGEDILEIRQPINPNPWELGLRIRYISWKF